MGAAELIVVFIFIFIVIGWIVGGVYGVLAIKKRWPGRIWLGLLLVILLPAFGQLYVDKAAWWILLLGFIYALVGALLKDKDYAFLITQAFSVLVIYYRMLRQRNQEIRLHC